MVGEPATVRQQAVLLRDGSVGVQTEQTPRKIQQLNGNGNSFYSSLNQGWLDMLDIKGQSEPTLHSLSLGIQPVIVQQPAIIIQPARVIQEDGYDG